MQLKHLIACCSVSLLVGFGSHAALVAYDQGEFRWPFQTVDANKDDSNDTKRRIQPKDVYLAVNGCVSFGWNAAGSGAPSFFDCESGGFLPRDLMELRAKRLYGRVTKDLNAAHCTLERDNRNVVDRMARFSCPNGAPSSFVNEPPLVFSNEDELTPESCRPVAWAKFSDALPAVVEQPEQSVSEDGPQASHPSVSKEPVLLACGSSLNPQYLTPLQRDVMAMQIEEAKAVRKRLARGVQLPRVEPNGIKIPLPPTPSEADMEAIAAALSRAK